MFKSKTLFVVGAGASKEVNFPIGEELSKEIIRISNFRNVWNQSQNDDDHFHDCFINCVGNPWGLYLDKYYETAKQITQGLPLTSSIDNFIDIHQNNSTISLLGKSAIAYTILKAEKNSSLYIDKMNDEKHINFQKLEKTWYVKFWRILNQQVTLDKLDELFSNISIVCFNYDRCIQHFLPYAISSTYSNSIEESQKLTERLKVYHPYGSIGNLFQGSTDQVIEFGKNTEGLNIVDISESIKTYTEQIEEDDTLKNIKREVADAETIVFLGFGFNEQNMNILAPTSRTNTRRVFATAFKISDPDVNAIHQKINSTLHKHGTSQYFSPDKIHVRNTLTCAKFFDEYQITLANKF